MTLTLILLLISPVVLKIHETKVNVTTVRNSFIFPQELNIKMGLQGLHITKGQVAGKICSPL